MIEKHSASQSSALADLQSELKSLKTLLLSRQNIPQPTPGTGASTPNGSTTTSTSAAANALLGQKGRSIPAWQMAPSRSEGSEAGSAGSAEGDKGKEKEQA
jgi:peroxin-14